jgi:hypothetical protein
LGRADTEPLGEFARLRRYPGAQQAIRRGLSSSRYVAYAPEHG